MKSLLIIMLFISFAHNASASNELRGGHPKIMAKVWDKSISIKTASKMQECVDSIIETDNQSSFDSQVELCINKNK